MDVIGDSDEGETIGDGDEGEVKRADDKGNRAGRISRQSCSHWLRGEIKKYISEQKPSRLDTGEPYRMSLRLSQMYSGRRRGEGRDTKAQVRMQAKPNAGVKRRDERRHEQD